MMPTSPTCHDKVSMRDAARNTRSALSPAQMKTMSAGICNNLLAILDGMDPLMVYVSKPLEVNTHTLINDLLRLRRNVVVPIIEKETRSLRLSYLTDPAHLVESTFRVPEPIGNELPARAEDLRAVIVPVLAFDANGHRLGYGAGYYDRFLAKNPHILKIGLAFSCQQFPAVPHDDNDVRMDIIITEKGILDCRQ